MVLTAPAFYAADEMERRREAYNSKEPLPGSFGFYVRRRRMELGLSQQALADRIVEVGGKYEQGDVSKLEVPGTKIPRPPGMWHLSQALEVPLGTLYVWAGHPDHADLGREPFVAEGRAVYDARLFEEELEVTDEELAEFRALRRRLDRARSAASSREHRTHRILVLRVDPPGEDATEAEG